MAIHTGDPKNSQYLISRLKIALGIFLGMIFAVIFTTGCHSVNKEQYSILNDKSLAPDNSPVSDILPSINKNKQIVTGRTKIDSSNSSSSNPLVPPSASQSSGEEQANSQPGNTENVAQNGSGGPVVNPQQGVTNPSNPSNPSNSMATTPAANLPQNPIQAVSAKSNTKMRKSSILDPHLEIAAMVGKSAIYESEVLELMARRGTEFGGLNDSEYKQKQIEIYQDSLNVLIIRELIIEQIEAEFKSQKGRDAILEKLKKLAGRETDRTLEMLKKRNNWKTNEEMKIAFEMSGWSVASFRRMEERNFLKNWYLHQKIESKVQTINVSEIRDYYRTHLDEFKTEDRVKWQDLFISLDKYPNQAAAQQRVDFIMQQAQSGGTPFKDLIKKYSDGFTTEFGNGETRGAILPVEAEEVVFNLKPKEIGVVTSANGYHIVRIHERIYKGVHPFDEKTQNQIRLKIQASINQHQTARIIQSLLRSNPPQIYLPLPRN